MNSRTGKKNFIIGKNKVTLDLKLRVGKTGDALSHVWFTLL